MSSRRILEVGRNCWRICHADKVSFLVHGENYFRALYDSLPLAQRQVMILSWDIHSRLYLVPPDEQQKRPVSGNLGDMLNQMSRLKPRLRVNILSWDFSLLFTFTREWLPVYKLNWHNRRRLKICLDDQAPLGASHHQKVVVIDDVLAFAGGLDLTRGRWDTAEHRADDPRRAAVDGTPLPIRPYHDAQMAVAGEIAGALGDLARERWRRGTGKKIPAPDTKGIQHWPEGLHVDISDVDVAVVRTNPTYGEFSEVREVEQLYLDSIAAARNYIYIENQYFTAALISEALAKRLAEDDGPEIILNLPLHVDGWFTRQQMDMMRISLIRSLRKADKHGRLGVYFPDIPDLGEESINLHSKLMIIDDRFVRIGSSNLNNRSMGLDTECDLAIEVNHDNARVKKGIQELRNRLLSEHLACAPDEVEAQVQQHSSVLKAIEALRKEGRSLAHLEPRLPEPDEHILQDIQFTDPEHPLDTDALLNHFVPENQAHHAGWQIATWLATLALLFGLAAAWHFTSMNEWLDIGRLTTLFSKSDNAALTPLIVVAAFVIGGLLMMPVTVLIIVSVLSFGPWLGFFYAWGGSIISALCGYGVGSALGRNLIRKLPGKGINKVSRQLAKRGFLTMLVLRIVPVAPFTIINLVAGATHIRLRDFMIGTMSGMIPGMLGIALLTDRVQHTWQSPDWETLLTLGIVTVVVFSLGYLLARHLVMLTKKPRPS